MFSMQVVLIYSIFVALDYRDVSTAYILGYFMQAKMDEKVIMKLEGKWLNCSCGFIPR